MKIDPQLERLLAPQHPPCVTILFHTHRTSPDNKQDPIRLKDLSKEAEHRLLELHDKRSVTPILESLAKLESEWDHQHNTEAAAIFLSKDITEVVQLPFPVTDRVVVDDTFATRELVRSLLGSVDHHILVLGREKAHLYQASNDQLLGEVRNGWPVKNHHWTTDPAKVTTARGNENQMREYFLDVDRMLYEKLGERGRVVVAGVGELYQGLLAASGHSHLFVGHLDGSHDRSAAHDVVKQAWTVAYEDQKRRHMDDLGVLNKVPVERLATAIGDIWRHTKDGRGATLFVERDLRIPVLLEGDSITRVSDATAPGVTDDIVDDIIEQQIAHGGDVRILPNDTLKEFKGIALVLRY